MLLIDRKERLYLIRLTAGGSFQTHAGVIPHDDLIGADEGIEVCAVQREQKSGQAQRFLALRPTLSDIVLKMPRGAQVIYPKDLGAIIMSADLFPGARVLEAGVGSGALSLVALRAGCTVIGYELRPDFANRARANVEAEFGSDAPYLVHERDVYEGISETGLDRVLFDLPEPWRALHAVEGALAPGGVICCYLPSINQTATLRAHLARGRFGLATTIEVLHRSWHIEGRAVRPDHRMVAHTGFITTARRIAERQTRRPPTTSREEGESAGAGERDYFIDGFMSEEEGDLASE